MAALEAWNDVAIAMGNVASASSFFSEAHPDEAVRSRGELAMQDVTKLSTELSLDRELYDLFAQVTEDGLDPQAIRLLHKTLRDFRRSGVDKDETTRDRVREINDRLTVVGTWPRCAADRQADECPSRCPRCPQRVERRLGVVDL